MGSNLVSRVDESGFGSTLYRRRTRLIQSLRPFVCRRICGRLTCRGECSIKSRFLRLPAALAALVFSVTFRGFTR